MTHIVSVARTVPVYFLSKCQDDYMVCPLFVKNIFTL